MWEKQCHTRKHIHPNATQRLQLPLQLKSLVSCSLHAGSLKRRVNGNMTDVLRADIGNSPAFAQIFTCAQTHTGFYLLGVDWDFEAIIGIKRLGICCDEAKRGCREEKS